MHHEFWHQRWEADMIGFHQNDINAHLKSHWSTLAIKTGSSVFVPLCGKSRDILWLAERHPVVGVELSTKAVEDFFAENALTPEQTRSDSFSVYRAGNITLYCGDFFALQADRLADVGAIYDRAALIALPPDMRCDYAVKLSQIVPRGVSMLLLTMVYDQSQMDGPPFAVEHTEVNSLFGENWHIEALHREDILSKEIKFRERGLSRLEERIYRLTKQ